MPTIGYGVLPLYYPWVSPSVYDAVDSSVIIIIIESLYIDVVNLTFGAWRPGLAVGYWLMSTTTFAKQAPDAACNGPTTTTDTEQLNSIKDNNTKTSDSDALV